MNPPIIATLELIEAHVRAQGQAAQFTYQGMLGGLDASVIVHKRVELVARRVDGRSQLAALAQTADAADEALAALEGVAEASCYRAGVHDRVIHGFRRALIATRDGWLGLEREFPDGALAELLRDHPSVHVLSGHTIDPETGGLHPAYAAVRRGRSPVFEWWSPARGFAVPATAKTESSVLSSIGGDVLSLPCELMQCLDLISLPDCDIGCDPGCL